MCSVWISEQIGTSALYSIKRLVLYNRGEECLLRSTCYSLCKTDMCRLYRAKVGGTYIVHCASRSWYELQRRGTSHHTLFIMHFEFVLTLIRRPKTVPRTAESDNF